MSVTWGTADVTDTARGVPGGAGEGAGRPVITLGRHGVQGAGPGRRMPNSGGGGPPDPCVIHSQPPPGDITSGYSCQKHLNGVTQPSCRPVKYY